jgi:hypothetical protein
MILFAGLRWETGTDWIPYYDDYTNHGIRDDFEFGYQVLVKVISEFGIHYSLFLLFCSLISIGIVSFTCFRIIGFSSLALLIFYSYYFLGSFLGAERRQFAIALCFLAILYIIKNKPLLFVCTILIAASFHISALIFLLAYPIYYLKGKGLFIASLSSFFLIMSILVFGFSNSIIFIFEKLNLGIFSYKIITYATSGSAFGEASLGIGFAKRIILIIFLFSAKNRFKSTHPYLGLLNIYMFSFIIYTLFMITVPMLSVMTIYFSIAEMLLIPLAINGVRSTSPIFLTCLFAYIIFQTTSILLPHWDLYLPYISTFHDQGRDLLY